jgi:hypothetical protein
MSYFDIWVFIKFFYTARCLLTEAQGKNVSPANCKPQTAVHTHDKTLHMSVSFSHRHISVSCDLHCGKMHLLLREAGVMLPGAVVGWFIPVAPPWSIGHPRNASFHFSFLI